MLFSSALFGFFTSCLLALIATPLARRAGIVMGWRDRPDTAHKSHHAARPYAGGVAVLAAIAGSLVIFRFAFAAYTPALEKLLLAVAPGALLVTAIGLLDDLRGCRPIEKLAVQAVALLLFQTSAFALGLTTDSALPVTTLVFVVLVLNAWMLGLTNSMNLIDGMDGLAAGLATTSAAAMTALALLLGDAPLAVLAAVLTGASLGFRRSNRSPARIYLGDGGSLLLGFGLAATGAAVWLYRPGLEQALSLILMTWVPLIDTGTTILRRLLSGVAIFQPDRDHLHHRLLARGGTTRSVGRHLIGLNLVAALCGLGIHAGLHPLTMVAVALLASAGVIRAALPLRVTQMVDDRRLEDPARPGRPAAQERAA